MTVSSKQRKDHHRLDRSSDAELRAIVLLNQDQTRHYPAINYAPRSHRWPILHAALPLWPSRFHLCRATTKVTRMIHDFQNVRIASSINDALLMLTPPPVKKPAACAAASSERAA
jgi:hypothetical protein